MKIIKKQTSWKKIIAATGIVFALGAASYGIYAKQQALWPFIRIPDSTTDDPYHKVNYSPPTDQEIKSSQDAKRNNSTQAQAIESNSSSNVNKKVVSIGVSYAGINGDDRLEIRAFTPDVIEGSGTCTATVSNGSNILTKSSPAFIDASSSICEPIYIDSSSLGNNNLFVTVSYSSPDAQGISDKVKVQ